MPFGESSRGNALARVKPQLLCGGEINIRGRLAVFYHVSADKLVKSVNDIYRAEIQRGALEVGGSGNGFFSPVLSR